MRADTKPVTALIDHAVINVLDRMDAAVERFRAFGFTLTERGYHSLGSINHLMVFGADYLELIGLPQTGDLIRREVADSPLGLNGLVFATDDAQRLHRQLVGRGEAVEPALAFNRPVTLDGVTHIASFKTVRLAPGSVRGGRVYFCEHETRHLVWRREWQGHRNGVNALAGFTIVVPELAREAALYARILGAKARRLSDNESELALGPFRLSFMTPTCYCNRYGTFAGDAGGREAFMGALALRTAALAQVRACMAAAAGDGVEAENFPARTVVSAASAFNTVLEFVE
jgi:catechol 2,3-dioxygenase-like lactoylglutathione lyase family enzyme